MDKEKYKIAIASSDGIVVNRHFGKTRKFYIYQMSSDGQIRFLEQRSVIPVCDGGNHDDEQLQINLEKIRDCKYLLVSRIGDGAANMAESFGIECHEIPGMIEDSVNQLVKYITLFE